MEMVDRLLGALAVRLHQIETLRRQGKIGGPRNLVDRTGDGHKRFFADFEDGWVVAFGNDQTMSVVSRVDVHKGQRRVVFEQPYARDLAFDDFAEHAILVGLHFALFQIAAV
jgi:hypothetical protein